MAIVDTAPKEPRETHERTVSVCIDGRPFAQLQASPYDLRELAVGALLSEGIILDAGQVLAIECDEGACRVDVRLNAGDAGATCSPSPLRGSSGGCVSAVARSVASDEGALFDPDDLLAQMELLCTQAPHRNAGECVHGCGIGQAGSRRLVALREDIGRHNAMDKAIGAALFRGLDVAGCALFITGRISAEMALKASSGGFPLLVSRKSATDDAVERADRLGVTLVSHCRDGRMRVLTHPRRIVLL